MASSPARAEHARRRRVVVGVSGSEASFAALAAAADEARLRDALLEVVTVDEPPPQRAPYAPPDGGKKDDRLARATNLTPDVDTVYERLRGLAPPMLQQAAQGAELLVIGHTDTAEVLGPTARACVAHSVCPVLVVAPAR